MATSAAALSAYHRPRKRPLLRLFVACGMLVLGGFAAGMVVWLRQHIVPPDCRNPATLALVRQSLIGHFHLPASVTLDQIRMLAGGYVAFRFVCEADLGGIDRRLLPPGSPIPGYVHYVSELSADHQRHVVHVSIEPLLIWAPVQ